MIQRKEVHHTLMESLVFRARHAILHPFMYVVPYKEWVLAGISYNHRGCSMSELSIKNFVAIRDLLGIQDDFDDSSESCGASLPSLVNRATLISDNAAFISKSINNYYKDMFMLMSEYLTAVTKKQELNQYDNRPQVDSRRTAIPVAVTAHQDMFIAPSFDSVPILKEYFATQKVVIGERQSSKPSFMGTSVQSWENSNIKLLLERKAILSTVSRDSNLFQMSHQYYNCFQPYLDIGGAKLLEVSVVE